MLLDKYDFYDIHSLLVGIRCRPDAPYNFEMIRTVYNVLSAPQETNAIESNVIRAALRQIDNIDKELYRWVYAENVYTYGWKIIKDKLCYSVLSRAFLKMLECAEREERDRLEDLADALHNIPIFFADGCKGFRKEIRIQFNNYNKKYQADLWKELTD